MSINHSERRERVIETVVSAFLSEGRPVNSAYVAEYSGLGLKPASIRALMKELENEGYLAQPHTSAGRIPTVKCYRYYVRYLMPEFDLTDAELGILRAAIEDGMREHDADLFLHHLAGALSELTDLVGVTMSPSVGAGVLERLEIVQLGGSSYLLVVKLVSGMINTISVTIDKVIPRWKIDETARLLTERLSGLNVDEIRSSIGCRLDRVPGGDRLLIEVILERYNRMFEFGEDRGLHVTGLSRVLAQPEFVMPDHSLKLVSLVEEKQELADALRMSGADRNGVSITIGGNGAWGPSPALSLISAGYTTGSTDGVVGVIGPTRLHYPRISALVQYAAAYADSFFASC